MNRKFFIQSIIFLILVSSTSSYVGAKTDENTKLIYAKDNLVAWCIVPFDAKKRGPEARAKMLKGLGINGMAYDWRDDHIPTFDKELDMLEKYDIDLTAFWLPIGLSPQNDEKVQLILDLLERRNISTQLWVMMNNGELESMDQAQKVKACAKALGYVAEKAKNFGGQVALYNHGGWYGQADNQIQIINEIDMDNVGMVYCFHHGHEHIDHFADMFKAMKPYLLTLSLNGMKKDGPKILPLGAGDHEIEMMRVVKESGWTGPVAILDHRNELDSAKSLQENLLGMQYILRKLGYEKALQTY